MPQAETVAAPRQFGSKVIDITELLDVFEAQEGEIQQIIGKTGNGKTYHATWRAWNDLIKGRVVYTSWLLNLPEKYDERNSLAALIFRTVFWWKKRFYSFDLKQNWHYIDINRSDLIDFLANLTDCIIYLDEGQDIFDSRERAGRIVRQTITRSRHLRKTLVIISQRAQAVEVSARANVTFFFQCVKSWVWWWPFKPYFKVYRTEEMDDNNYPIWENLITGWRAPLFYGHFADKKIFNLFNSWYLRGGIERSQDVHFEAYDLTFKEKIKALLTTVFHLKAARDQAKKEKNHRPPLREVIPKLSTPVDNPQLARKIKVKVLK